MMNSFFGGIILLFAIFYGLTRPSEWTNALDKIDGKHIGARVAFVILSIVILILTEIGAMALAYLGLMLMGVV